jgi:hypothetical protein
MDLTPVKFNRDYFPSYLHMDQRICIIQKTIEKSVGLKSVLLKEIGSLCVFLRQLPPFRGIIKQGLVRVPYQNLDTYKS